MQESVSAEKPRQGHEVLVYWKRESLRCPICIPVFISVSLWLFGCGHTGRTCEYTGMSPHLPCVHICRYRHRWTWNAPSIPFQGVSVAPAHRRWPWSSAILSVTRHSEGSFWGNLRAQPHADGTNDLSFEDARTQRRLLKKLKDSSSFPLFKMPFALFYICSRAVRLASGVGSERLHNWPLSQECFIVGRPSERRWDLLSGGSPSAPHTLAAREKNTLSVLYCKT